MYGQTSATAVRIDHINQAESTSEAISEAQMSKTRVVFETISDRPALPPMVRGDEDELESCSPLARDDLLVRALLAGDEEAFERLVQEYHTALLRLAKVYVRNLSVAEEVVQETWLAVLRGLKAFEGRSSLKTWIFRILTNRAKSRGIREGRTTPFSALAGTDDDYHAVDPTRFNWTGSWRVPPRPWDQNTPERLILNGETRELIEAAIDRLPAKQKAVVSLRDVEGWGSNEVCDFLDISETYQRVLLHRGRSKVRQELERHLSDN